jgi:hypothetical protein
MNRPDFDRTGQLLKLAGPDRIEKIRLVPTLLWVMNEYNVHPPPILNHL